jgi:hypothetical protein
MQPWEKSCQNLFRSAAGRILGQIQISAIEQQCPLWRRLETSSEHFVSDFVEKSNMSQDVSTKCADKVGDEDT